MYQRWANLLFLHWAVDPEPLKLLLPPGVELDTFEGRAYVGLVPFTMTGVRPWWAPAFPPLSNFHETNVRTYVHRNGADPGVWFFSLDAANSLAVRIARAVWRLPYHRAKMSLDLRPSGGTGSTKLCVEYETERLWPGPIPARCAVRYTTCEPVMPAAPGTLEHFLAERYLLYAARNGRLYCGQVHHAAYPLQIATVLQLNETIIAAAGIYRGDEPPIAHYASELKVRIYPLRRVA